MTTAQLPGLPVVLPSSIVSAAGRRAGRATRVDGSLASLSGTRLWMSFMTTLKRIEPLSAFVALWAVTLLLAPHRLAAAAGVTVGVGAAYAAPARPGYPPRYLAPYPAYYYAGACLRFGGCAGTWGWDDRYAPRRPVAPDDPAPLEQDIWGTAGSPWGYVRRMPPPTPEAHIQPRYKDASTIRPEYDERTSGAAPR